MSTQSGTSSEVQSGVLCYCELQSPVRRAWTRLNPGRRFYGCRGRRQGNGYATCKFFRWYDEEEPSGWQHLALLEAREIMQDQRNEIGALTYQVRTLTLDAENDVKAKELSERCEALTRDVLVLTEKCVGLRNVLVASSIGFAVVIGGMMAVWTSKNLLS